MGNGTGDPAHDDLDDQDQLEDFEDLEDIEDLEGQDDQDQDDSGDDDAGEDFDLEKFKADYKDKSPDDLIAIIAKQKREYGRQSTDVGDLRKRLDALEKPADDQDQGPDPGFDFSPPQMDPSYGFSAPQGQAPQQMPGPEPGKDWDYEKPVDSTRNIVRNELTMYQQAQMVRDFNKNRARAKIAFDAGSSVLKKHKNLFGGIEREVKSAVYGFYYPMVMNGAEVDHFIRDEQAWITAAQNIRLRRGEYDRVKVSRSPKPMAHTKSDTPGGIRKKGGKRPVALNYGDKEIREMMEQYKLTKAEAEDVIRTEQDMINKGDRR